MSKEAVKWAEQQRVADPTLMALIQAIAWYADKGTNECRCSQAALASKVGVTDRAIRTLLVVLEQLEVIERTPRNKGRYGRTTDLITLSTGRHFDVSRGAVRAIRNTIKPPLPPEPRAAGTKTSHRNLVPLPPEPRAAGTKTSHRNLVPLPPEPRAGEYNQGDQEVPYQVRVSTNFEGSSTGGEGTPTDRAGYPSNVIPLMSRGAA